MAFESTIDAIPPVPGLDGRPGKRPGKLHADKGYDYARCRRYLRLRGMTARIARKGIESRDHLGRHRWAVERTHAWFASFGKLRIRFERGWTAMLRSFRWQLPSSAHVSWVTCVSDKKNGFTLNVNPFFSCRWQRPGHLRGACRQSVRLD